MRAYATQVEVLRRLRNGGQQFVHVEHVHVNDGGQAVIGNVKKSSGLPKAVLNGADQLDKAGQTILQLLHRAAGVAEENSRNVLETAQKLSYQLRAEDRIAELEAEVTAYQERADRAEQWLHRVYTEIEDRFLQQNDGRRGMNGAPQQSQRGKSALTI
jgi:hypothetical protein